MTHGINVNVNPGILGSFTNSILEWKHAIAWTALTATTLTGILGTRFFLNAANHVTEREACANRLINRSALVLTVAGLAELAVITACMQFATLTAAQALIVFGAISLGSYVILAINNLLYLGEKETLVSQYSAT